MLKKLVFLTPATLIVCSLAVSPVFAIPVVIKKSHYSQEGYHHPHRQEMRHHQMMRHHYHDNTKVIIRRHD